jgi:hypothetical protein
MKTSRDDRYSASEDYAVQEGKYLTQQARQLTASDLARWCPVGSGVLKRASPPRHGVGVSTTGTQPHILQHMQGCLNSSPVAT